MKKGLTKEIAQKMVSDVPHEKRFWVHGGQVLRNLGDLAKSLPKMTTDAFNHHVNEHKNDFANWVKDVIGDSDLATKLKQKKDRKGILSVVRGRFDTLRK